MAGRSTRHVPRDSSRRRVWVYLAVAAFILIDVLLVVMALGSTHADANAKAPQTVAALTATPPVSEPVETPTSPAVEPVETPTPTGTPIVAVPPTRILAAFDATTVWRAETGACPAAKASPELTTDAGKTWKSTDATGTTEVTALQRIKPTSARVATMIGFNQTDCSPEYVKTYVAGDNYSSYPKEIDGVWYVNPANRAAVHSPSGDVKAPCAEVIALAPRDDNAAAVLCADQTVFTTTDSAATWAPAVVVPGAVNLTVAQAGYVITSVGLPECAGVQLIALSAEPLRVKPTGCLPVSMPAETMPGNVAVSEAAGTVWLWAGKVFKRSQDEGISWQ
jgi:hypothetical protein